MDRAEEIFNRIVEKGEATIDDFILSRASEELFLDFKRSSDNGAGRVLSQIDRNNLAKAISGFGNSEGGVIVWGVDCSNDAVNADVAKAKVPLADAKRFQSWLEGSVSGCTVPPHSGVRNATVLCGQSQNGFVVTLVPKSNHAPHQTVGKLQYYIRAGSDFVPTPHGVLAGMFGRRPQPKVYIMFGVSEPKIENNRICAELGVTIRNDGPGIARDLFISYMIKKSPGPNTELGSQPTDLTRWVGLQSWGCHISLISNPEIRLAPESQVQPVRLLIKLAPPFDNELEIEGIAGCAESVPHRFHFRTSPDELEKVYRKFSDNNLPLEEKTKFLGMVFSLKD